MSSLGVSAITEGGWLFRRSRRRWHADADKIRGLLFARSIDLLTFLDGLVRRSRLFYRREKSLPIVCFYEAWDDESPIEGIENRLRGQRRIVVSRISEPSDPGTDQPEREQGGPTPAALASLQSLLDQIVAELSGEFPHVRRLRFPHYALGTWLLFLMSNKQEKNNDTHESHQPDRIHKKLEDALKQFIDQRYRIAQRSAALPNLAEDFPSWIRWPLRHLPPLGLFLMRSFWHAPRWFRRRPIGSLRPGSFTGLARKFAEWDGSEPDAAAVSALLVDSFLEDLRRAYRRNSLLGAGRRRTTHPVLFLEPRGGGNTVWEFLSLVSAQRNSRVIRRWTHRRSSRWDPLLIITQGDDRALQLLGPTVHPTDWPYGAANADYAHDRWLEKLDESGPAERSWLLPLRMPERPEREPDGIRGDLFRRPLPTSIPVVVPMVVVVAVLAGLMVGYSSLHNRCGALPWAPYMERSTRSDGIEECVGLASPSFRFFRDRSDLPGVDAELADELIDTENKITRTNDMIEQKSNTFVTIAYLGILTPADHNAYRSELEQLRGLAVAQAESMSTSLPLRVMLANAGDGLDRYDVATRAITQAHEQYGIVGVTGLGISREETRRAASNLAIGRIPTIGIFLSATDLATRTTQYYHQVGPTNVREAAVIGYYIKEKLKADRAAIYWSADDNDLYSSDLARQARQRLPQVGVAVTEARYQVPGTTAGSDINSLGHEACQIGAGVVFYAGRSEQLLDFLRGMKSTCEGRYPRVILGDDANRFALESGFAEFPGLTLDYVSFGSSLAWGPTCDFAARAVGFYETYRRLFNGCSTTNFGPASLSYDAALVFILAIQRARSDNPNLPSGDLVLGKINELQGERSVSGASGRIEYTAGYGNGRVPINKSILILRVKDGRPSSRVLLCGRLETAQPPPDPQCPTEGGR